MADTYLPRGSRISAAPDAGDIAYAEAFDALLSAFELLPQKTERLALLYSTCRNAYLTANALFVEIAYILGHGRMPSRLSQIIHCVGRGDFANAKRYLGEVSSALKQYEDKQQTWATRVELDAEFRACLSQLKPVQRDRVLAVLDRVRTESVVTNQSWSKKYYAVSSEEPSEVSEAMQHLHQARNVVQALVEVASLLDNTDQLTLFEPNAAGQWERVYRKVKALCATLDLSTQAESTAEERLVWHDSEGRENSVGPQLAGGQISTLLVRLGEIERSLYESLAIRFRANVGVAPLPAPFKIDLTRRRPDEEDAPAVSIRHHKFGDSPTQTIRLAAPGFGLPLNLYTQQRFKDDDARQRVTEAAKAVIQAAARERASVVVFPEYFLPRTTARELADLATREGMIFIGGQEGTQGPEHGHTENAVLIKFPCADREYIQAKHRPSGYEGRLESSGSQLVFSGTALGTFTVLVCSDFLESDILSAIAGFSHRVDFLVVCSLNPHPALFQTLAEADAVRLYAHVCVVNNRVNETDPLTASSEGSIILSPKRKDRVTLPTRTTLALAAPLTSPELLVFEVASAPFERDRGKPLPNYLPVPVCRTGKSRR